MVLKNKTYITVRDEKRVLHRTDGVVLGNILRKEGGISWSKCKLLIFNSWDRSSIKSLN